MSRDRSRNERTRRRAYNYTAAVLWPSVCRQYLMFMRWIVSANMANLQQLYRGFFATPDGRRQAALPGDKTVGH
jgi:hypothetical protein